MKQRLFPDQLESWGKLAVAFRERQGMAPDAPLTMQCPPWTLEEIAALPDFDAWQQEHHVTFKAFD